MEQQQVRQELIVELPPDGWDESHLLSVLWIRGSGSVWIRSILVSRIRFNETDLGTKKSAKIMENFNKNPQKNHQNPSFSKLLNYVYWHKYSSINNKPDHISKKYLFIFTEKGKTKVDIYPILGRAGSVISRNGSGSISKWNGSAILFVLVNPSVLDPFHFDADPFPWIMDPTLNRESFFL